MAAHQGDSAGSIERADVEDAGDPPGLDVARLARWMDDEGLPGAGRPLSVTRLSGGSQNDLFELRRGEGERLALRRPPPHAALDRAVTMAREVRVLRALAGSDVPHPRLVGGSDDPAILGGPFYVTELVDGWSPMNGGWQAPFDTDLAARAGLAIELVEGIARLARVDWRAAGLEGFGRPDGFHERQVDRWLAFLADYQFRELPGLDDAAGWLRGHRPRWYEPGIMHGDYQFANVMFRHGAPARLAAIIDWEMATVGDPLLDLGWVLVSWPPEGDDMDRARYLDLDGMPPRDALLEHYASVSGRPVDDIDYYVILARFKLAIVLEKSAARYAHGRANGQAHGGADERVAGFGAVVLELMRKAADLARTTTLR
ncbi:MAG: phosphotransferase family protein [Acidimicrobiales bacterium]